MQDVRRPTILDAFYGQLPVAAFIRKWDDDLTNNLLEIVWKAYDNLHINLLSRIDWTRDYDDVERSITELLERAIQTIMDPYLPFHVQNGPYERESRSAAPAQPPQYDIAFVWNSDPRIMWPLEAKVLRTDDSTVRNLGDYVETIEQRYLTCTYAPFSDGGAMLGYLKQGDCDLLLANIQSKLGCTLKPYPAFTDRSHKVSDHQRVVPQGRHYIENFRCHHMIMPMWDNTQR